MAGTLALVWWARSGCFWWLIAAVACGTASLWTVDAATVVYPFTPLVVWLGVDGAAARRRAMWGSALWLAAAMPYYATLAMFLRDGSGYAAQAIVAGSWPARLVRLAELVLLNFTPWEWAFSRHAWFAPLPAARRQPARPPTREESTAPPCAAP